jgi:hypothetical protein
MCEDSSDATGCPAERQKTNPVAAKRLFLLLALIRSYGQSSMETQQLGFDQENGMCLHLLNATLDLLERMRVTRRRGALSPSRKRLVGLGRNGV